MTAEHTQCVFPITSFLIKQKLKATLSNDHLMYSLILTFVHRLTEDQYSFLCKLEMKYVFSVENIFVDWMHCGIYDFHHLPYSMKAKLSNDTVSTLEEKVKRNG